MTPFLEWIGFFPAAVSAVHALYALARMWQRRPWARSARPSLGHGRPLDDAHRCGCGCAAVTPVDATTDPVVEVRVTVSLPGGAESRAEQRPW